MAKKTGKKKSSISIRTITTWTSVAAFTFFAAMVGLTAWFVIYSLNSVGNPPIETGSASDQPLASVNVRLMNDLIEILDEKTGAAIPEPNELTNPFVPRSASTPAEPAEGSSEPAGESDDSNQPDQPAEEPASGEDSGEAEEPAGEDDNGSVTDENGGNGSGEGASGTEPPAEE